MAHDKEHVAHEVVENVLEGGTHVGVELTKDILHALVENPVPFLDTALSLIKVFIEKALQASANQAQLKRISDRVVVVKPFLERLKKTGCKENIILAVNEFVKCLSACVEQADKYSQQYWLKRFLMSGTDKEKFAHLMERLNHAIAHVDLGLSIETNLLLDQLKRDEEKDRKTIITNMTEIMRLAEKSLRHTSQIQSDQTKMRVDHAEQNELLGLKLQSISLQICDQLQLTGELSQRFLEQQFQLLHERFKTVNAVPSARKPPIPPELVIRFCDLTFERRLPDVDFGFVWAGEWQYIPVSIKRIGEDLRPTDYIKFVRAVQIAAQLRHPNITQLYGACLEPEACLVTEYMSNNSLSEYLVTTECDVDKKVQLALDIAKGLIYLHQRGILHRDLRPQNILINEYGTAKLNEFVLSKILDKAIDTIQERPKDISWSAPEVVSLHAPHTQASEVYTYGLILWFIFSQQKPCEGILPEKLVQHKMDGHAEKIPRDTPEDIASLIKECWSLDLARRPGLDSIIERLLMFDPLKQLTPRSLCRQGKKYEESGQPVKAYTAYLRSAQGGFFGGQTSLAVCLAEGKGCKKNPQEAFKLMLSSAKEHNHGRAQFNVALMFELGDGTVRNLDDAKTWYEKAEAQGVKEATQALAELRSLKK